MNGLGDIQFAALRDGVALQAADEIERLRAEVAKLRKDAERYQKLRSLLLAADFDYGDMHESVLVFSLPDGSCVSANLDITIDAMKEQK